MRILVVEFDKSVLALLAVILKVEGHVAHLSTTIEEGLQAAITVQPDLILMDSGPRPFPGLLAVRHLKENCITRRIPVLLTSTLPEHLLGDLVALADGLLRKPFDFNQLLDAIGRYESDDSHRSCGDE